MIRNFLFDHLKLFICEIFGFLIFLLYGLYYFVDVAILIRNRILLINFINELHKSKKLLILIFPVNQKANIHQMSIYLTILQTILKDSSF